MDLSTEKKQKIGIMGGTFDPVHYGHLVTAEAVRAEFNLDKVLFIPAGKPPHKDNESITEPVHRYRMTVLAAATNPHFEVSRLELEKSRTTYTVDTIKELISLYGEATAFYFITGADAILEILTWHKAEELLSLCQFVAATRPGFNKQDLEQKILEIQSKYNRRIFSITVPSLAISSTDIRNRVRCGMPIKYLLPEGVEKYIQENGIYR